MCAWSSSQVLVVMICTPHVAHLWVVRVSHVIHACSKRCSSTFEFSIPSNFLFSTSSTTLKAVVTLCNSPKRRWTQLTSPTSSQMMSSRTTTSWKRRFRILRQDSLTRISNDSRPDHGAWKIQLFLFVGMSFCTSWKRMFLVDLGEPTSFLDHVCLGCTQRQCDNYRTCLNHEFPREGTEKFPNSVKFRVSSWSHDMEGHTKKCVEAILWVGNKTTQLLYEVSTPWINDHHFKEEEIKSVGELWNSMFSNCYVCFRKSCIYSDQLWMCVWNKLQFHTFQQNPKSLFEWD